MLQEQVQDPVSGFGLPHWEQNFPEFMAPQEQVQDPVSGFGLPHWEQNFPELRAPQEQVQLPDGVRGADVPWFCCACI